MTDHFDSRTMDFYFEEASRYLEVRPDDVARHLPGFLSCLKPGALILELGCGGGQDAALMIERGFAVEPTDGVVSMATKAEERLAIPVRVMRFDELDAFQRYDAVVATASLLHAPRDGLFTIIGKISQALKAGGLHVATFKTGGLEGYDEHGRYYNYPSRSYLEDIYRKAGNWSELDIEEYDDTGYFSADAPWLKIVVRKNSCE